MGKKVFFLCFIFVLIVFFTFYYLTSIIPHNHFNTHALDLGMFNHALYSYAHFKSAIFTLGITNDEIPYLGDHFSPITMLYAPFYYLFGTYTLLLLQIFAILFGGFGIYKYSRFKGLKNWLSLMVMIHFFLIWGINSALKFDFHNNVIASMLIPWLIYYYDKGNWKLTILFFFLILISKENMALWIVFIMLALLLRKEKQADSIPKLYTGALMLFAFVYFIVIFTVVMPSISNGHGANQLSRYYHLGYSVTEIFISLLNDHEKTFTMLFENSLELPGGTGIKSGMLFLFLVSGGFAVFQRPHFLVMLIPIYALKMFSSSFNFWGIHNQYSIEFVPVISLALISLLGTFSNEKWKWLVVISLIYTTYHYNKKNIDIFKRSYYNADMNLEEVRQGIKIIPEDAIVSVNSQLAPHLSFRDKIYHFPIIKNAEYVALLKKRSAYPLRWKEANIKIDELIGNSSTEVLVNSEDLIILKINKRKTSQ